MNSPDLLSPEAQRQAAEELCRRLDPSLTVRDHFGYVFYDKGTLLVERGKEEMILKYSLREQYRFHTWEVACLQRLWGIEGTAQHIGTIERGNYLALLKTYVEGTPWEEYSGERHLLWEPAAALVGDIHSRGVARLDLYPTNILVHDGRIRLFDFDTSETDEMFRTERTFRKAKQKDLRNLWEVLHS